MQACAFLAAANVGLLSGGVVGLIRTAGLLLACPVVATGGANQYGLRLPQGLDIQNGVVHNRSHCHYHGHSKHYGDDQVYIHSSSGSLSASMASV